jgi:peptide/nickel transport system substrate-binding protein
MGIARRRELAAPMTTRRLAGLLLFLVALAGCARPNAHGHELRLALAIDPTSLSPLIAFDQNQIALDQFWCQTLVGLDERNRFIPILVTRIPSRANGDVSADGLRIVYRLRRDARFADGVALTSADVAFTYRAILEPDNAAVADAYRRIAALATPDAHTVVVRLRRPWSAAVHVLFAQADFAYGILPAHAFATAHVTGSPWEQRAFGTGPFRVVAWHRGESIELAPNPYFRPRPKLTRISIRIIPDQTAAFNALQTHDVDAAELNPDNVREAAGRPDLRIARTPENGLRALYLQTAAEPTNDARVRRAIAAALDLPALAKAWHGVYPAARSVFPAPVVTWSDAPPAAYPHDLSAAARELDAAGWRRHGNARERGGRPLELLVAYESGLADVARISVLVQQQLAQLGAVVTVKAYPSNLFTSPVGPLRTGRFALTPAALIGGSDPEQSLNIRCDQAQDGGENYARYCSRAFESLFADQLSAASDGRRNRDFAAIARVIHDEVPLVPLYDLVYEEGVDRRVTGYRRNMLRYPVHPEEWDAP